MAISEFLAVPAGREGFLRNCLPHGLAGCYLPELGTPYRGKVRDCYTVGDRRILVATDRISAFDRVFAETIPFKGEVLNRLSAYFLRKAAEIVPTHLLAVPDPNVTVGRELVGYPVEVIVRGYLTGSAGRDYQEGTFGKKYGFELPAGLAANARFETPIVTPTSKAFQGHDEPISAARAAGFVGGEATWRAIVEAALALFAQGKALAASRGLILVDTKYEFGHSDGRLMLMDEVHTPDSSRFWYQASYDRDPERPEQLSKEFLRDWLRDQGFTGDGPIPALSDEIRIAVAARYIQLYETLLGETFAPESREVPENRIWRSLKGMGLLKGAFVGILMGSASDDPVAAKVAERLASFGIASRSYVVSAHKVPDKLHALVDAFNRSLQPMALVTIAGRSNGLSGATAANSLHPVIALPVFADSADYQINIHSSLQMPSDTPAMVVIDPGNAALAAARILAINNPEVKERVAARIADVRATFEGC